MQGSCMALALTLRRNRLICALHQQQAAMPLHSAPSASSEAKSSMSAARSVLSRVRAYLRYRDTVSQLSRLSDRDLADLGITRTDIPGIARS